jgi:hypothetical protein
MSIPKAIKQEIKMSSVTCPITIDVHVSGAVQEMAPLHLCNIDLRLAVPSCSLFKRRVNVCWSHYTTIIPFNSSWISLIPDEITPCFLLPITINIIDFDCELSMS